jgi:hypothetical protein
MSEVTQGQANGVVTSQASGRTLSRIRLRYTGVLRFKGALRFRERIGRAVDVRTNTGAPGPGRHRTVVNEPVPLR